MGVFGRKEIAALNKRISELKNELEASDLRFEKLKSENLQLNEKCSRYQSELNRVHKENEDLKRKQNEISGKVSGASGSSDDELAELKKKLLYYENYSRKLQDRNKNLVNLLWKSSSQDNKNPIYKIMDEVREKPEYMSALYLSQDAFLSPNEYKMYILLENLVYENRDEFGDLSVFANTRLADMVKLFEEKYSSGDHSFCKMQCKNPNKKEICALIDKHMPDFNDEDYKLAFLYPLLRMHVDFLICDNESGTLKPILAIELHGSEHDCNSEKPDWNIIHNDEFKEALFNPKNKSMNVRLLVIKNDELNNEEGVWDIIYEALGECLEAKQADNTPTIPDIVKGKRWNRKIYGQESDRFIYVNNNKVNITDEQEKELESYISVKNSLLS